MNKDLVLKLIKVANNLDIQGHYKEASELDKIASVNPVGFTANKSNQQVAPANNTYTVSGNYANLIQTYKSYIANNDAQGATNYFNAVMRSNLTPKEKSVFRLQAERIRNNSNFGEFANDPDEVMINGQKVENNSLTDNELMKYLTKHHLYDRQYTRNEFDRRWNNFLTEIKNDFVLTPGLMKQLNITKKMIELKVR